jgi:transposase-like protein
MVMTATRKPVLTAGEAPAVTGSGSSKRYSVAKRKALLSELGASGESMAAFCSRHGVSTATICAWRKRLHTQGEQGLVARKLAVLLHHLWKTGEVYDAFHLAKKRGEPVPA